MSILYLSSHPLLTPTKKYLNPSSILLHLPPSSPEPPVTSWEIIMPAAQGPKIITRLGMKGCWNANWSTKQQRFSADIMKRECIIAITQLAWFLPAYRMQQRGQSINTPSYYSDWLTDIWYSGPSGRLHAKICGNKASRKEKQSSETFWLFFNT